MREAFAEQKLLTFFQQKILDPGIFCCTVSFVVLWEASAAFKKCFIVVIGTILLKCMHSRWIDFDDYYPAICCVHFQRKYK